MRDTRLVALRGSPCDQHDGQSDKRDCCNDDGRLLAFDGPQRVYTSKIEADPAGIAFNGLPVWNPRDAVSRDLHRVKGGRLPLAPHFDLLPRPEGRRRREGNALGACGAGHLRQRDAK